MQTFPRLRWASNQASWRGDRAPPLALHSTWMAQWILEEFNRDISLPPGFQSARDDDAPP